MENIKVLNFRQLGGYPVKDGRKVRMDQFYRGGALIGLDETTKRQLDELGLKHVLDFRSQAEIDRREEEYVPRGVIRTAISANRLSHEVRRDDLDFTSPNIADDLEAWLKESYRLLPFENPAYREAFAYIRRKETPFYFHCSTGKDRTGVCAALILLFLGADEKTVYEDYLKSYDNMIAAFKNPGRTLLVFPEWLEGSLEEIKKRYPGLNDFFQEEFGITPEERKALQDYYLE